MCCRRRGTAEESPLAEPAVHERDAADDHRGPDQDPDVSPRMMTKEEGDRNLQARGITESIFTLRERARVFGTASP